MTNGLDAADRVTSVVNAGAGMTYATINYAAANGVSTTMTMGNNVTQGFLFNDRVQPTGVQVTSTAHGSLLTLGFSPCASGAISCSSNNGNLQSQTITAPGLGLTQTYSYDHLNRLTGASETGGGSNWSQSYGFDATGNRWVPSNTGLPNLTLETPAAQSLYSTTIPNRLAAPESYDNAGNVLQVGGMARNFTYDAENRQVTANLNGTVTSYQYDGNGLRVSKATGTQTRSRTRSIRMRSPWSRKKTRWF